MTSLWDEEFNLSMPFRQVNARKMYLHCNRTGVSAFLPLPIDLILHLSSYESLLHTVLKEVSWSRKVWLLPKLSIHLKISNFGEKFIFSRTDQQLSWYVSFSLVRQSAVIDFASAPPLLFNDKIMLILMNLCTWDRNSVHNHWTHLHIATSLTQWGCVTHICISNLTIIGSDNGLSPGWRQAIIWTNAGIVSIGPLGTNFSEISIEIYTFSFRKMYMLMSSGKWRPFCLDFNSLRPTDANMRRYSNQHWFR